MFTTSLCLPAIIYIGFTLIQIFIDIFNGIFKNAFIKFLVMLVFSVIINILCDLGYTVIAWVLVFIPIIMMTVVSTLLLKVFGTSPDEKNLRSKVKLSDNSLNNFDTDFGLDLDSSNNHFSGKNLLNQQKYAYFYDKFNSVKRIDRDDLRDDLYDKIDEVYDLSFNKKNDYDLSHNPVKFSIVNKLLNVFGESIFINNIINSRLFNDIFNNNNNYNNLIDNNLTNSIVPPGGVYDNFYRNQPQSLKLKPEYEIRADRMDGTDFESYAKDYNEYLLDGQLLYQQSKFSSVKDEMKKLNPNVTEVEIDKEIEKRWNNLSAAEQHTWNKTAENDSNEQKNTYDSFNLTSYRTTVQSGSGTTSNSNSQNNQPCPINETPITFNRKTGLTCYEVCPPGKQHNSAGLCVRPCPSGQERKIVNGDCKKI
jgi:hypothetical protein